MKVEVEKRVNVSINIKEYNTLIEALNLLKEMYNELDKYNELDSNTKISNKVYETSKLIKDIVDEVSINTNSMV